MKTLFVSEIEENKYYFDPLSGKPVFVTNVTLADQFKPAAARGVFYHKGNYVSWDYKDGQLVRFKAAKHIAFKGLRGERGLPGPPGPTGAMGMRGESYKEPEK